MCPNDPASSCLTPLHNPLPVSRGGTCHWLLTNRIWQRWWDVTCASRLHSIVTSVLLAKSLHWLSLLMKQVAMVGRPTWQHWRVASSQQLERNKALSPTPLEELEFCQQPLASLEVDLSTVELSCATSALADTVMTPYKRPYKPCLDSWPTEMCFKLLSLWQFITQQ